MKGNTRGLANLKHFTSDQDREAARVNGAKGGRKSGETKRRRKLFSEAFEEILSKRFVDGNGNELEGVAALAAKVYQQAMDGDMRAFAEIRNTVGEQPVQRIETVEIPPEAYENVKRILEEA